MQTKYISFSSSRRSGPLRKLATLAGMVVLGVVALMFSAVLLVVILAVVVFGGAWLWWKTREMRRQIREAQAQMRQMTQPFRGEVYEGEIIEGVAVRVDEPVVRR